jgi:hypothetical protein
MTLIYFFKKDMRKEKEAKEYQVRMYSKCLLGMFAVERVCGMRFGVSFSEITLTKMGERTLNTAASAAQSFHNS